MKFKEQIEERLKDCKTPDEKFLEQLVAEVRFAEEVRWETERQVLEWVLDLEEKHKKGIDDYSKEYLWDMFVEFNKLVDKWDDIYCKILEKEQGSIIEAYNNGIGDVFNDMSYVILRRPIPKLRNRYAILKETLKEYVEDDKIMGTSLIETIEKELDEYKLPYCPKCGGRLKSICDVLECLTEGCPWMWEL